MATIYFGYGSNLWQDQMLLRCPSSKYLGIARLRGYRWIINARGYANVVETHTHSASQPTHANESWGLVYSLQPDDEARLDVNEGVPEAYTKEDLEVEFWPASSEGQQGATKADVEQQAERRMMLVYIDRKRVLPDQPWPEYVFRMNKGLRDALREGVPGAYVEEVIRKFIPDVEDGKVEKLARQQALMFEDERLD